MGRMDGLGGSEITWAVEDIKVGINVERRRKVRREKGKKKIRGKDSLKRRRISGRKLRNSKTKHWTIQGLLLRKGLNIRNSPKKRGEG